ncbi:hypothetical protein [Profundibacter sp.]
MYKNGYDVLSESGALNLRGKPDSTDIITVGDWVMTDQSGLIHHRLERLTALSRPAAGEHAHRQMIAANTRVRPNRLRPTYPSQPSWF